MIWLRQSMNKIDLIDGDRKLAYIAYIDWEWKLFEGGEEWGIGLKVYNSHQVEEAQRAAVNELIRYHTEKAELFQRYKTETAA